MIEHQLEAMVALIGVCAVVALFTGITKALPKKRKYSLLLMEIATTVLLISDRYAYIFRGNVSSLGFWMVRISNFLVFFMTLFVTYAFNVYLIDLFMNEGNLPAVPKRLQLTKILFFIGELLVIISQFTDLYYTFDSTNHYVRSPGFVICYLFPMAILLLQLSVIIQYRKRLSPGVWFSLFAFNVMPLIGSLLQIFAYGLSITNIFVALMVIVLYVFALFDINDTVDRAHKLEIESIKKEQRSAQVLLEQAAQALVSAIDAKDKYTRGHSARVAKYTRQLAELAGKSEKECNDIYYAALMHDVGKIGISGSVINKNGKLTNEEYEEMKKHPIIGGQILSSITMSPMLKMGANYHHERYDGKGYPEGLKGDEIPDVARLIAVADAYDAMTSKRSYRVPMPQPEVREEIVKGIGTQFDPKYARLMLRLIDNDTDYQMKENT